MTSNMPDPEAIETAEHEARAYATWLAAHGYREASVWWFRTALNCYGAESSRTSYAAGYAVRYAGTLIRDDGSTAEYPTAGVTVFCQDTQLPLARLVKAGRALVAFGDGSGDRSYGPYTPMYVAGWNPRGTSLQRDQSVNPGVVRTVILHELTPGIGGDGPLRFYDMRLDPAGDLATGSRVRVVSDEHAGLLGTIAHPDFRKPMVELDPIYDPGADTTRPWGQLRQIPRASLEPGENCADGHPLRWNADDYDTPRWVHVSIADLAACTAVTDAGEARDDVTSSAPDYGEGNAAEYGDTPFDR